MIKPRAVALMKSKIEAKPREWKQKGKAAEEVMKEVE